MMKRMRVAGWLLACALGLLCFPAISMATQMYRWVDQGGRVHYSDQPPPPESAQGLELRKFKGANVVDTGGAFAFETEKAVRKAPLTLYTADSCKDDCVQARALLRQRGAPYTEKELRTQADAEEFRKATGSTELFVPVLLAGTKASKGFEESTWNRLLDEMGYPRKGDAGKKPAVKAEPGATGH